MKKILLVAAVLLTLVTASACGSKSNDGRSSGQDNYVPPVTSPGYAPPMTTSSGIKAPIPSITVTSSPEYAGNGTSSSGIPEDRMIVRTGNISMVVDDITAALESITQMADGYKGYVVSSNTWKDGERIYGSISIRIPAGSYDIASKTISQMAVEVTSQSTSSQDVTEEYVDLTARLSSLQATEAQLLLIMSKANLVTDILAVQYQLTSIQSQIEQIKGRMQYLEKTSATSLINVSLSQAKLEAKFNASSVNAKTGDGLQFYPDVAGGFTPYSYVWDFGDGKTSTECQPRCTAYAKTGEYSNQRLKSPTTEPTPSPRRARIIIKINQGGWSIGGVASAAHGKRTAMAGPRAGERRHRARHLQPRL